jgi:hypothetical protein
VPEAKALEGHSINRSRAGSKSIGRSQHQRKPCRKQKHWKVTASTEAVPEAKALEDYNIKGRARL